MVAAGGEGAPRGLLHHAAWTDDVDLVRALLGAGADLQVLDEEHSSTPLARAGWAYASGAGRLLRTVSVA